MNKNLGEKILKLREEGYSYNKICETLKCSKGLVSYHLGLSQKEKTAERKRINRYKKKNNIQVFKFDEDTKKIRKILYTKYISYIRTAKLKYTNKKNRKITFDEFVNALISTDKCYLTGDSIDIYNVNSYHIDHKIPRSKGGNSDLNNLGASL